MLICGHIELEFKFRFWNQANVSQTFVFFPFLKCDYLMCALMSFEPVVTKKKDLDFLTGNHISLLQAYGESLP